MKWQQETTGKFVFYIIIALKEKSRLKMIFTLPCSHSMNLKLLTDWIVNSLEFFNLPYFPGMFSPIN